MNTELSLTNLLKSYRLRFPKSKLPIGLFVHVALSNLLNIHYETTLKLSAAQLLARKKNFHCNRLEPI